MAISVKQMEQIQAMIKKQTSDGDGLLSFKAGRATLKYEGGKKMIYSDKKRGKVRMMKSGDGILHFEWRDRIKKTKELDVMCLPECAKWIGPLKECKDGSVFVLEVQGRPKQFFWVQENPPTNDEEKKAYDTIFVGLRNLLAGKEKDAGEKSSSSSGTTATPAASGTAAPMNPALAALSGAGGQQNMAALQNALLQALGANPQAQQQAAQQAAAMQAIRERLRDGPDLTDIVNGDVASDLIDAETVAQLAEHLPEGMRDAGSIRDHLNSPQLRSTLNVLQRAVNGENAPMLFQQMGLSQPNDNQNDLIGTTRFLEGVQRQNPAATTEEADNSEQKEEDKEPDKDKEDKPDNMDTES